MTTSAPPRRSARLSQAFEQAKPTYHDSELDSTDLSSVESYDSKSPFYSKHHLNKGKRASNEVNSRLSSQVSKKPKRGHSYPLKHAKVSVDQDSRRARPKTSLSSRYFDDDVSHVESEEASLDTSLMIVEKSKDKGKARLIKSDSSEQELPSEDDLPIAPRKRLSTRKTAPPAPESPDSVYILSEADSSDVEAKMVRVAIELSKQTSKSKPRESTSKLRPKPTSRKSAPSALTASSGELILGENDSSVMSDAKVSAANELSKPTTNFNARQSTSKLRSKAAVVATNVSLDKRKGASRISRKQYEDDEEDSEFKAESHDEEASSISSLSSPISDSEDDHEQNDNHNMQHNTTRRETTTSRTRRTRRQRQPRKYLTWWEKNQIKLERHHPELIGVWGDLSATTKLIEPSKAEQPNGLELTLLPFQLEGLDWMQKQEAGPWSGGVLADEMGMGKTIQTIALILSDRVPEDGKQTLVIAPTVAIIQWRNEIEKFAKGLTVNVWHGGNRSNTSNEMKNYDVVLTSFAVLESTFRRQHSGFRRKGELVKEPSLLHKIQWHRVILDEAHNIKDRACNTAKGAFALIAKHKWCLSGTPLQNRVGELYSLIRFLGAEPFSYYFCKVCSCKSLHWRFTDRRTCDDCGHSPMQHTCFWNNEILKPIQKYGASVVGSHGHTAFSKLKVLLDRLMLRRTKLERADDLGLPPRAVLVRRDYFTEEEEELYSSLYSDVTRKFSTFADAGTVLNNYGNIFQLITRMRQMSNHPDLVLKSRTAQAAFKTISTQNAESSGPTSSIHTCRICLDEAEDAIISRCRHIFCRECIRQYLETATEQEPECPVCHLPITIDLSQDALECQDMGSKARQGILDRLDPGKWRTSTKIEALVEELSKLNQSDHTIKSIVFSQFTVFLDLIERRLLLAGFKLARLQGNMTPEARDRTIQYFMNNNDVQVFLVSLKAGGVALNLTEASRVFIMDPWWNPAVELQAMDRIHRLGQHRPVVVTRLIIENSIESRIVELQKKKEDMTGAALGDDDQALGRLTPEDLSFLFTL